MQLWSFHLTFIHFFTFSCAKWHLKSQSVAYSQSQEAVPAWQQLTLTGSGMSPWSSCVSVCMCVSMCVCVCLMCSQGWKSDLGLMSEINPQWSRLLFSLEAASVKPCWCLCVSVSVCLLVYIWTLCQLQNKNLSFIQHSLSLFEAAGINILIPAKALSLLLSLWLYCTFTSTEIHWQ